MGGGGGRGEKLPLSGKALLMGKMGENRHQDKKHANVSLRRNGNLNGKCVSTESDSVTIRSLSDKMSVSHPSQFFPLPPENFAIDHRDSMIVLYLDGF